MNKNIIVVLLLILGINAYYSDLNGYNKEQEINNISRNTKENVIDSLDHNNIKSSHEDIVYSDILNKLKNFNISSEEKKILEEILSNEEFKRDFFNLIKNEQLWSNKNIIISLILGFLYGFAYLKTLRRVKNEYLPIDIKTFGTFSLTSGGMILVNGFVPGSIVYLESFILAGWAVLLHIRNKKKGNEFKNGIFDEFIDNNPLPIVKYDNNGYPVKWNSIMENTTGYKHDEIKNYYKENGEIMSLLYDDDELKNINYYLSELKRTGVGYKNIAFTLTAKNGQKKNLLWTTIINENGENITTATELND